jgi:hypothetical protein
MYDTWNYKGCQTLHKTVSDDLGLVWCWSQMMNDLKPEEQICVYTYLYICVCIDTMYVYTYTDVCVYICVCIYLFLCKL